MSTSTHLLVGNPTAQSGKNQARIQRALGYFRDSGVACDFFSTQPEGKTIELVSRALDGHPYRVVVTMGGDGTFREVAAGLLGSRRAGDVPLAMLPTGTANDQGRSFGLESDDDMLERNVAVAIAGHETRLDAGRIRALEDDGTLVADSWFFDSAGWGFSARVLAARNRDRKVVGSLGPLQAIYRDQAVYAGAAIRTFLESYVVDDKFRAIVEADGERHDIPGLTDLIVKGTRIYAGAWVFDDDSKHDDGFFEVVPFRGKRDWTSKAILDHEDNPLTAEILEQIGVEHSKGFRGSRILLDLTPPPAGTPIAAQIDGEEFPATPRVEIEVSARAIRLIVPAGD